MPYKDIKQRKIFSREYYLKNRDNQLKINKLKRKHNPTKFILLRIRSRCTNINATDYKYYGGRGIKCLITEEEIRVLWDRDKAHEMKQPSIDRIDNNGNYCLENCRFIELSENIAKAHIKAILQYDLTGRFLFKYNSLTEASKITNINISDICSTAGGKLKTAGGYIWRYKN